jgi:hypothetical protein
VTGRDSIAFVAAAATAGAITVALTHGDIAPVVEPAAPDAPSVASPALPAAAEPTHVHAWRARRPTAPLPSPDRIRVSSLSEWMQFRHARPLHAASLENAAYAALQRHGLAAALEACGLPPTGLGFELTAEVRVHGGRGTLDGWGCSSAASGCACLVAALPEHLELVIDGAVSALPTQVDYDGEMSLDL